MIELRISVTENVGDEDVNHDLKAAQAYAQAIREWYAQGYDPRHVIGAVGWVEERASAILAELLSGKGEV